MHSDLYSAGLLSVLYNALSALSANHLRYFMIVCLTNASLTHSYDMHSSHTDETVRVIVASVQIVTLLSQTILAPRYGAYYMMHDCLDVLLDYLVCEKREKK